VASLSGPPCILNASALSKPDAVGLQQLSAHSADLTSCEVDVAVITDAHLNAKHHSDSIANISDWTLWRRDRPRRRGGGMALDVRSTLPSSCSLDVLIRRPTVSTSWCRGDAGRRPVRSTAAAVGYSVRLRGVVRGRANTPSPDLNRRACRRLQPCSCMPHGAYRPHTARTTANSR